MPQDVATAGGSRDGQCAEHARRNRVVSRGHTRLLYPQCRLEKRDKNLYCKQAIIILRQYCCSLALRCRVHRGTRTPLCCPSSPTSLPLVFLNYGEYSVTRRWAVCDNADGQRRRKPGGSHKSCPLLCKDLPLAHVIQSPKLRLCKSTNSLNSERVER